VDFYQQTVKKIQEKGTDSEERSRRLKDAELEAADTKGRKEAVLGNSATTAKANPEAGASQIAQDVTDELNAILKRSPSMHTTLSLGRSSWRSNAEWHGHIVIIFSKSYCPYSKKAKDILLEKYKIVPAPFVVELDLHPHGREIQDELQRSTGRRTVPNVLINGMSIGGGDDVAELDSSGLLIDKVKTIGGKRIMEIALKPSK
jgi:glutaredoxin